MNDTYYIKINGKANIAEPLFIGHNFRIDADCSITSESKVDNEDGTFSVTWKAEPVTVTVTKDNGEKIKAKDTRRNSQKHRNYLYKIYMAECPEFEFEDVYDELTNVEMSRMYELFNEAIKRLKDKYE